MTINGILDWIGISFSDVIVEQNESKGLLYVAIPEALHVSRVVQQLLKSFELFVEQLSEQYKEYVSLERRDVNDNKDK